MKLKGIVLAGLLATSGWCTQQNTKDEAAFAADSRCRDVAALLDSQRSLVISRIGGQIWVASYVYTDGHLIPENSNETPEVVGKLKKVMQDWDVCRLNSWWDGNSIKAAKFTWPEIAATVVTMIWNNAE